MGRTAPDFLCERLLACDVDTIDGFPEDRLRFVRTRHEEMASSMACGHVHASQDIPHVAFDQCAELIGLRGVEVERSAEIADAWRRAFAADRPVIVAALTDPEDPRRTSPSSKPTR